MNIIAELEKRGYNVYVLWKQNKYRGGSIGWDRSKKGKFTELNILPPEGIPSKQQNVYPEHDENYLDECIANLAKKGVTIDRKRAIERLNAA